MKISLLLRVLPFGLAGVLQLAQAAPLTYTYTPISVPNGASTVARSLNNAGQIVGSYADGVGTHGFLYSNGSYTTINAPGGTSTELLGINNLGQIVGAYQDSSNTQHLFLDNNGAFTTIDPPRGLVINPDGVFPGGRLAAGINDRGQIVSTTSVQNVGILGFLYDNGQFSFIPPYTSFSATSYFATGINNAGQISLTGYSIGASSFVYSNGTLTHVSLGIGLAASNTAFDINNAGDVAGTYNEGDAIGAYVSSSNGVVTRFDRLSSPDFWRIYGINDAGQIVGSGLNGAVLATPNAAATPEPASLILMASGLAGVGLLARYRRQSNGNS